MSRLVVLVACLTSAGALSAQTSHQLTDQRGKTFAFPQPADRVATIAIPLFWTFMTVDGSDARVVGANSVALSQMRDGIAGRVFPRSTAVSTAITRGGTFTPNIEALLALRPDAVFQWADRGDDLMASLDRVGLRAIGVKNTSSESDIEAWMRMSGVVAGRQERADSIIRWMQSANRRFDSLASRVPAKDRPRVLMLVEYSRALRIDGPKSYSTPMIQRAGGVNAAASDGAVGLEQVLAWNPDVIFLSHFEAKTPQDVMHDPRWSHTTAAQTKRVYKLPFGVTRWGGYGPESPLLLTWMTNLLQPSFFELPLRDEMRAAYRTLYRYYLSDAELDQVLQMDENAGSAAYDRFASRRPR